jgi:hypothetical protein
MILKNDDRTKAVEIATRQKILFLSRTIPVPPSIITARKKFEGEYGLDDYKYYCYNDEQQKKYVGLLTSSRIQMRLILSLVFAILPGVSLVPLLACSDIAAAPNNEVRLISSSYSPEEEEQQQQQQQQDSRSTADAARLLLDDVHKTTNKRQKEFLMKQMTLDDQRLVQCEEESSSVSAEKNAMDWEQCFFYGTTADGVSSRSPSSSTSMNSDANKMYDSNNDKDRYKTVDERIPLPSSPSSSFGNNAVKISFGGRSKIPTW